MQVIGLQDIVDIVGKVLPPVCYTSAFTQLQSTPFPRLRDVYAKRGNISVLQQSGQRLEADKCYIIADNFKASEWVEFNAPPDTI